MSRKGLDNRYISVCRFIYNKWIFELSILQRKFFYSEIKNMLSSKIGKDKIDRSEVGSPLAEVSYTCVEHSYVY